MRRTWLHTREPEDDKTVRPNEGAAYAGQSREDQVVTGLNASRARSDSSGAVP